MTESEQKKAQKLKEVKVRPGLHQQIDIESAQTATPMYQLVQAAWDCYLKAKNERQAFQPVVVHADGDAETITIPADLRPAIEQFIRFATSPITPEDGPLRDFLLLRLQTMYSKPT